MSSAAIAAVMEQLDSRFQRPPAQSQSVAPSDEAWTLRRWEAGATSRLNRAHWENATGQPINFDLVGNLRTLCARCAYEAANNPIVQGVINTHAIDVVGKHGPRLQVLSDSSEYNDAAEKVWRGFFAAPDITGQLAGADLLRLFVSQWWTFGEHLVQLTSDRQAPRDQISLRVAALDPLRLDTDSQSAGDPSVVMGVRRDRRGKPTGYQICQETPGALHRGWFSKFEELGADEIIHQFQITEPGQVRGVPLLASALPVIAELRDYDQQVLDAARLAASQGVIWYTDHPDATYVKVNEVRQHERNVQMTGPPGWKPMMVDPKQPQSQYVAFRTERLRELGRPVCMPLMKILLGSERHNFAAARMDAINYQRALEVFQGWLERVTLNRLLALVLREASLVTRRGKFILPKAPENVAFVWGWTKQPHIDPVKERNAERIGLENGTLPFADACALENRDEDDVIKSRQRTEQKLRAAGLPPVISAAPPAASATAFDNSPPVAAPPTAKTKPALVSAEAE